MGGKGLRRYSRVMWPSQGGPQQRRVAKIGRNEPCPCGSGRKYKDCHQKDGSAYLKKLARQEYREELRQARQRLKEDGVPWYRRIFV